MKLKQIFILRVKFGRYWQSLVYSFYNNAPVVLKDRYKQIQADTTRYKQIRPDTNRYKQIQPDTNRYKQIHPDKTRYNLGLVVDAK